MEQNEQKESTLRRLTCLELTINGGGLFLICWNEFAVMDKLVSRFDPASMNHPLSAIDEYLSQFDFRAMTATLEPFGSNLGRTMCDRFRDTLQSLRTYDTTNKIVIDDIPLCRIAVTHGAAVIKLEPTLRLDDQVVSSVGNDTKNLKLLWENHPNIESKDDFWKVDISFPGKVCYRGKFYNSSEMDC